MTEGIFTFNLNAGTQTKLPISHNIDFEKYFDEFLGQGEELPYINKSIDTAIHPTDIENLSVPPSGKIPPNPAEVIGSQGSAFLMELLKKKFDFIILNTPPVMPATDAMLMAPRTD